MTKAFIIITRVWIFIAVHEEYTNFDIRKRIPQLHTPQHKLLLKEGTIIRSCLPRYATSCNELTHRRSQDFLWGELFPWQPSFLVVVLNTQAKTTKLTTPTLHLFPPSKKILKNWLVLCLGCIYNLHLRPHFFSVLGVYMHPLHPITTHTS